MQKKRRNVQSIGVYSPQRTFSNRCFKGNKYTKTNEAGGGRPKNDFLKKVFRPIPAVWFNPLFNPNSYDCLYASAKNYAGLLGSHFDLTPSKKDFLGLFSYFQNLLPEGQFLLLIEENDKLLFKIFFGEDFLLREVFYIPVILLNRTEGIFRDILLTFLQHLHYRYKLPQKENVYDYEMIVDCYFEEWNGHDEEDPEQLNFLEAYRKGYINDTFSLIYQMPVRTITELEKLIKNYIPENQMKKRLIASIRQGINILQMDKNIFDYLCHPEKDDRNFDNVEDECIIGAERLFRFIYSNTDFVTESYLEYLNTEITESVCEYFPRKSLILYPETDRLLEVDFVEYFFTWLIEFITELNDYETQ